MPQRLSLAKTPITASRLRYALAIALCIFVATAASIAQQPALAANTPVATDLSERLDTLMSQLESMRDEMHIPGMAIAVVKDDKVVMARGFGSADLASATPVTPETVFAIGSTTKAFTASLVGMLVDEGKMSWDDPITKYLPYFELELDSEDPNAFVSIRDLLAHRTGFTRMGLLWAGNMVPREEVLKTATSAKAWSEYRGDFFYNNVTYMAAGVAAEKATGKTWEDLVAERFFSPLDMKSSTVSVAAATKRPDLSLGYTWKEESQKHDQPAMRPLDAIAPAGSINSNVLDMSQWVRFQLNRGRVDGKQILSEEQLNETWTQQIAINDDIGYGMGWMLRDIGGHRVVEHGGNIDGFSAQVTLLPEENMGFVLLMNLSAAPLQTASSNLFVDAMLGEAAIGSGDSASATDSEDLSVFTGKYVANFGPFKDARFTVSQKDGALAVDVPGQTNYELKAPDEEDKRYFVLTDQIAVSFDRNEAHEVVGLKMYQGGMAFELPREGVTVAAEIPLEELQRYLGTYHLEENGKNFEVVIQNQRLAVDIPGQMVAELRPPDDEGRWVLRITDRVSVKFAEGDDGTITSMTLTEPNDQSTLPKVASASQKALPSLDALMALRTNSAASSGKAIRLTGKVRQVHSGVSGTFVASAQGKRQRIDMDFGRFGWTRVVVTEDTGRSESNLAPTETFEGKYLLQAQIDSPAGWFGDLRPLFDKLEVVRRDTINGTDVVIIRGAAGELPPATLYLDAETGDVVKSEVSVLQQSVGIAIPTVTTHSDFRLVDGQRVAFRSSSSNDFSGESLIELTKVEFLDTLDPSLFAEE